MRAFLFGQILSRPGRHMKHTLRTSSSSFTVVDKNGFIRSAYEVTTSDVFVIRGNTAALRCEVPASVRDFIHVVYWETDDGLTLHSGTLEEELHRNNDEGTGMKKTDVLGNYSGYATG
ncbi:hypothetical protein HPB50_004576 [Hyalomma asiaticum]|uniref:Uncharacterized protein n=1 Tax=Hyalomma asiaticum TaxID=266040 RepID=A0ACB7SK00_HYAAI|nr:hypothetical protein HPB50_004576 [Hyalomma asiaticum]